MLETEIVFETFDTISSFAWLIDWKVSLQIILEFLSVLRKGKHCSVRILCLLCIVFLCEDAIFFFFFFLFFCYHLDELGSLVYSRSGLI
jgi:hypothetical protein